MRIDIVEKAKHLLFFTGIKLCSVEAFLLLGQGTYGNCGLFILHQRLSASVTLARTIMNIRTFLNLPCKAFTVATLDVSCIFFKKYLSLRRGLVDSLGWCTHCPQKKHFDFSSIPWYSTSRSHLLEK